MRQLRVGTAVLAVVVGAWAAPAGASPEEGGDGAPFAAAVADATACGSWWEDKPDHSTSISVCASDGLGSHQPEGGSLGDPFVYVADYTCFHATGNCEGEVYDRIVPREDLSLDPLLRRASLRTTIDGCVLDVEFAGIGAVTPGGGISEYHTLTGEPYVEAGTGQGFTRAADWWGSVCGRTVVAHGQGVMSRTAGAWAYTGEPGTGSVH